MTTKKKTTKQEKDPKDTVRLDKLVDQITDNVVKVLSPKIDALYDKITKPINEEIKDIRGMLQNQPDPINANPNQQGKGGLGDQLENLMGSLASGNIPLQPQTSVDPNQQQPQQNPMQILELIKMFKMFDKPDPMMAGINPKMMQEIGMRQQIAMTNMTNNLFAQVVKDMMKKIGADDSTITDMDLTNEHLMGKVHHLGKANKDQELKIKIMGMANKMKQEKEDNDKGSNEN